MARFGYGVAALTIVLLMVPTSGYGVGRRDYRNGALALSTAAIGYAVAYDIWHRGRGRR